MLSPGATKSPPGSHPSRGKALARSPATSRSADVARLPFSVPFISVCGPEAERRKGKATAWPEPPMDSLPHHAGGILLSASPLEEGAGCGRWFDRAASSFASRATAFRNRDGPAKSARRLRTPEVVPEHADPDSSGGPSSARPLRESARLREACEALAAHVPRPVRPRLRVAAPRASSSRRADDRAHPNRSSFGAARPASDISRSASCASLLGYMRARSREDGTLRLSRTASMSSRRPDWSPPRERERTPVFSGGRVGGIHSTPRP